MFTELRGRTVLVTGGAQGIGEAIVSAFAGEGARVFSADLAHPAEQPDSDLSDGDVRRVHLDVSDERSVEEVVGAVRGVAGVPEVLVNAAGISTMAFAVDAELSAWQRNIDVNATGSFLISRAVAREQIAAGCAGRIILISSQAGKNGYRGMSGYVASKHAVMGLTKTLAVELAPQGITVNAICPGIIETGMKHRERREGAVLRGVTAADIEAEDCSQVPLGRTGTPQDVAGVALFLASGLASYMTGQGINVTGGMTMH